MPRQGLSPHRQLVRGLDAGVVLSYGAAWLLPYMVFTVASISNYATAIGLGSLLAACALVLILSERRREKAALILLPSFGIASFRERPVPLAGLLALAGFAASLSFVTLTIRYLAPGNPWARFMLPWFPLIVTPLLVPVASERGFRAVRTILLLGILVHLWTAIVLVGTRYLFGQG